MGTKHHIDGGAKRPRCAHCGKPYGQRAREHHQVKWDAPNKEHVRKTFNGQEERTFMQAGDIPPPPPYRGNGYVVQESDPYVSATDGKAVMTRWTWDGESFWTPYKPFCTTTCAIDFAQRAYRAGVRLK